MSNDEVLKEIEATRTTVTAYISRPREKEVLGKSDILRTVYRQKLQRKSAHSLLSKTE